ncbi:tetratricopeptide repeat protein [Metasolibacillus sp. FSL H7-0170]|uniref:tetratricopeptide repeat protein n=1 Tax=Metasolibacillus TaxID=2703677 RepID=UPI00079BC5EE|nr:tetratricopeptide repeat protein [Metasolibacillus fluoroglycofenilyticus]KYG90972.1 hypothetical protein A0U40_17030 [[Bacillus] sp. KCTC 13219]
MFQQEKLITKLPKDEQAFWFKQLEMAKRGEREAIYKLVQLYGDNGWHKEKVLWLQQIEDEAEAQYELANYYFEGLGVEENEHKALNYYKKAALQNHADAANNLADMYLNGEGVEVDEQLAFYWFRKAAEAGVVEAMFTLGIMHEQGLATKINEERAFHYYLSSANGGYVEAQYRVGMVYLEGSLGQQYNLQKAIAFFLKAATVHHIDALFNLGYIFAEPQFGMQDGVKAIHYFKQAALLGDTEAKLQLAQHYESGIIVARNEQEARRWHQAAKVK